MLTGLKRLWQRYLAWRNDDSVRSPTAPKPVKKHDGDVTPRGLGFGEGQGIG